MKLNQIFTSLLSPIFPERADHRLVNKLTTENVISLLRPTTTTDFTYLVSFQEPRVRALIHEAKFHGNEKAWQLLAVGLHSYLKDCPVNTLILPIPLSKARKRARGYNQIEEVAKRAVAGLDKIELNVDLLYRQRDTAPQTTLKRAERLTNVTNAFQIRNTNHFGGRNIIILDDVATTGATLKAAEAVFRPLNPASITCLSLAH